MDKKQTFIVLLIEGSSKASTTPSLFLTKPNWIKPLEKSFSSIVILAISLPDFPIAGLIAEVELRFNLIKYLYLKFWYFFGSF